MSNPAHCSKCGAPVSDEVAGGFCMACLLEEGLTCVEPDQSPITLKYFGDYELIEEVARGGMGVVFKARQRSLGRIVAVKMILSGHLASEAEAQRFRAEARAAAALQHPGIVAIHEVGEHESLLFFSMDYVEGKNLAEIVRDGPLVAIRAAQCLRDVAEAIHYAHEQGVLHRDLKPSNVLIDSSGKPHVTDFGLAKRLAGSQLGTETPELTVSGQLLGSPNFMPPEQAAGKHRELTPASDVYSLGALLYHLLTGRPPFLADNIPATLQLVSETEPVSPRLLAPGVPRDLETICLKCLEKDPQRRYGTANELVEELERFLNREPIHARPIGAPGKTWRWCRRKPALASAFAACVVVLTLGIIGITWQWRRAEANATNAQRLRARAEQSSAKSGQVAEFLKDMLGSVSPAVALGRDTKLMKEVLDNAAARVGKDLTNQPIVEAELRDTLSGAYLAIGDSAKATEMARRAVEIWRKSPQNGQPRYEFAGALNRLAQALRQDFKDAESEAVSMEALEVEKKLGKDTHEMAISLNDLGLLKKNQRKLEEAERYFRQAQFILTNLFGSEHHDSISISINIAQILRQTGRPTEAEALYRDCLAAMGKTLPAEHPDIATALNSLALLLQEQGRFGEAETIMRRVLVANEKVFGSDHHETAFRMDNLAVVLGKEGKHAEAEAMHRKALALLRKRLGDNHPAVETSWGKLGRILEMQNKWSEAELPYREALILARTRATNDPGTLESRLYDLADNLYRQRQFAQAEPLYREFLQSRRAGFKSDQEPVLQAQASLARLLADWVLVQPTNSTSISNTTQAKVRSPFERASEAEMLLQQCLVVRLRGTNATHWRTGDTMSRLGSAVLAWTIASVELTSEARRLKLEEAEKLLIGGYQRMQQSRSASSYQRDAVQRLVHLYEYWDRLAPDADRSAKANEWKKKLGSAAD